MPIIISWASTSDAELSKKETMFATMITLVLALCTMALAIVYVFDTESKIKKNDDSDVAADLKMLFITFIVMATINGFMSFFSILLLIGVCMSWIPLMFPWLGYTIPFNIVNTVCGILVAVPSFRDNRLHQGILYVFVWIALLCLGIIATSYIYDHYKQLKG